MSLFVTEKIEAVAAGELIFVEMEPANRSKLLATCTSVQLRVHGDGS